MVKKVSSEQFISLYKIREVPLKGIMDYQGKPIEKILKYWRVQGLVPFMEKGKWARISFAELIWLRILDSLRQLNMPVQKMKLVCSYFFQDSAMNNLPEQNFRKTIEAAEMKSLKVKLTEEEDRLLKSRKNILENHKIIFELLKADVNHLTDLIYNTLNDRKDCGIAIFSDYTISEVYGGDFIQHDGSVANSNKPHIYLSISNYLQEFIHDEELSRLVLEQMLTDKEIFLLNQLRDENVSEITIQIDKKKLKKIECSSYGQIDKENSKLIKEFLVLKNYEKITLTTRNESTLSFKRTRTTMMDSD